MGRKKVFFVTYGGVHANIARFVQAESAKHYDTQILALTMAPLIMQRYGVAFKTIKDYLPLFSETENRIIRGYGEELAKTEYNSASGIEYADCVAYLGIGFYGLVGQTGSEEKAMEQFVQLGRKAFCPVEAMKSILRAEQADVVVLTCDVRYELAAGLAANELDIPVVCIHDLPQMNHLYYDATLCVMNEYAKEYITEKKICPKEKIRVTGQPVLEDNTRIDPQDVAAFKAKYHVDQYKKVVTFLEQSTAPGNSPIEALLQREAAENPDILYVAKLHPNQNIDPAEPCTVSNFLKLRDCSLKALLSVSGVAITFMSNSGMEAALMGVPLIVAEIGQPLLLDFSKYGIAAKATSIDELKKMIYDMLDGTLVVCNKDFNNVPNAAKNIVEVLGEVM